MKQASESEAEQQALDATVICLDFTFKDHFQYRQHGVKRTFRNGRSLADVEA